MVKTIAKHAAKAAAGLIPAAVVAGLGMPALGALVLLAALVLVIVCWVIGNQARTDRASQILLACRGTAAAEPVPAALPAGPGILTRTLTLVTGRKKQKG